jgi:hypothetical protein
MKKSFIYFICFAFFAFTACNETQDLDPVLEMEETFETSELELLAELEGENLRAQNVQGNGLKNLSVTGELANGDQFKGTVSITELGYDETLGLVTSGEVRGIIIPKDGGRRTPIRESFTNVPATLADGTSTGTSAEAAQRSCRILFLDLGPIFLDVLGLQVDLSQIILDVTAVGGSGNLLGNLLCAVAGLLDPLSGLLAFLDNLGQLLDLLGQINNLLG